MNKHRVMNFLLGIGYWTGITESKSDNDSVCFNANDEDGLPINLIVIEENEEYVVYQTSSNEDWLMVDLPI